MEDLQEDPLALYCFCVCSRSALLGDLLGISRSMERDLPSVLSVYHEDYLECIILFVLSRITDVLLY